MGDISKNFSLAEFAHSKKAFENGINNVIPNESVKESIRALVVDVLQPLRDSIEASICINSGYRSEALNALLGGAKTSQHRKGEAADIRSPFVSPLELARRIVALNLPYDQVILYPSFVHVSHKRKGVNRKKVLYDSTYNGEKI